MRVCSVLLIALLSGSVSFSRTASDAPTIETKQLIKHLVFNGDLTAVNSVVIATPNVSNTWTFPVTYLAPEGIPVEPGELLVTFDSSDMLEKKIELENTREQARIELAKKAADLQSNRQDILIEIAQAEKDLAIAELYAALDTQLISRAEAEKYRYDQETATVRLSKSQQRLANHDKSTEADLGVQRIELERTELQLQQIVGELGRMSIRAPTPGLPLYGYNNEGRKIQIGDTMFKGWPVIRLPDMGQLKIVATVFDTDFPFLQEGQSARVILDASPDRVFPARISRIPKVAKPVDRNSEMKVFQVDVLLLETDLTIMKPGMSARVEVDVPAGKGLIINRRFLNSDDNGTFVVTDQEPPRTIPVKVLDSSTHEVLIEGDLTDTVQLQARGLESNHGAAEQWHKIKKEELRFMVSGSGVLSASRSVQIKPPPLPNTWRFKIAHLIPEGTNVKAGELLLRLDPSEWTKRLQAAQAESQKAEQEFEKTEAALQLNSHNLELQIENARVEMEKAANKLQQARQFESNLKVVEQEHEARLAERRVQLLEKKLELTRLGAKLQLDVIREKQNLHRKRTEAAETALQKMQITAPIDGVVIYASNWNNEKKQVGHDAYVGESLVSLPDLTSLGVEGQVSEVESGKIHAGQRAEITLDALPDLTFGGKITEIGKILTKASDERPVKVIAVKIELDGVDEERMRPGMVARIQIIVDRFENVLTLPLSMVKIQDERAFVWVKSNGRPERREVEIGKNNGIVVIVRSGLSEGDEVLQHPPLEAISVQ